MTKMKKTGIIAFCGSKGSGKSTSATLFRELFNGPTEEVALAGHLKEVCAKVFKIEYEKFINPAFKEIELEEYIVLNPKNLAEVLKEFFVLDFTYDANIRPHVGKVITTPRSLLQYIGTEALHPIDPLIHVKVAMRKKDSSKLTLITDLRFMAEFQYFKQNYINEFLPVYVKNEQVELRTSIDSHASEREFNLFKLDCTLLNNENSLADLRSGINLLIKEEYEQI